MPMMRLRWHGLCSSFLPASGDQIAKAMYLIQFLFALGIRGIWVSGPTKKLVYFWWMHHENCAFVKLSHSAHNTNYYIAYARTTVMTTHVQSKHKKFQNSMPFKTQNTGT